MSKRAELRERREQRKRRQRLVIILAVAGGAIAIAALLILQNNAPIGTIATPAPAAYPQTDGSAMGDSAAPVVIEEYSDFQCPFCKRFHDETLPLIVRDYVATGKVYFSYHHFPVVDRGALVGESHLAATAAVCAARQNLFWSFHDTLFANQTGENIGDFTSRRLETMAETVGLDLTGYRDCLANGDPETVVRSDVASGTEAGLTSTPSFVINGDLLVGAQPYEVFQSSIEAALTAATP
jgi:protein-disulfide isomerase